MADPKVFEVDEQEGGSYLATLLDDLGSFLPGSQLATLTLTLYVVKKDGTTSIVNNRDHQNVLNLNNVTVYDTLQALNSGRTYNLRWKFTGDDTRLVEALSRERHIALFEWTWAQGNGKHDLVLNVRNLTMVS